MRVRSSVFCSIRNPHNFTSDYRGDAEDPLLGDEDEADRRRSESPRASINALKVFASPDLRKPLMIVSFAMMSQQISGINAGKCQLSSAFQHQFGLLTKLITVLYYSNAILSKALPDLGPFVSLGITIVNVIMTFPPIFLIEVRAALLMWRPCLSYRTGFA